MLHSPKTPFVKCIIAAFCAFLCIAGCGYIGEISGTPLLIASFGASTFIVSAFPSSPFAQPINIFGAYFICALCAVGAAYFLPHEIYSLALAIAAASFFMLILRVPHPPAAGVPIVTYLMQSKPDLGYILFPVLTGAAVIVLISLIYNNLVKRILPDAQK